MLDPGHVRSETFGTQVRNRYAARVRPQVYRRPDIAFVLQAEGAGEEPSAPREGLNSENPFLVADVTAKLSTRAWPERHP